MEYTTLSENENVTREILHCRLFEGDVSKCKNFFKIQICLGTLSIISCLAVITYTFTSGNFKVLTHRLVLYQAVASLVESVCQILNWERDYGPLCTFFGWLIHFAELSLLMWVVCISIHAFVLVKKGTFIKKEYVLHLLGWGFPLFLSLLPFSEMKFGPAGMWCWIVHDWPWRMSTFYIPVYVVTFAMIVLCSFTIYYVHKIAKRVKDNEDENRKLKILKVEVHLIIIYPFVYLALELVPLIHRVHNAVHGRYTFAMVVLHGMSLSLRGFINAVVFIIANKNGLVCVRGKKPRVPPDNINQVNQNGEANLNTLVERVTDQFNINETIIANIQQDIISMSKNRCAANNTTDYEKPEIGVPSNSQGNTYNNPGFENDETQLSDIIACLTNLTEQMKASDAKIRSIQEEIQHMKQRGVSESCMCST